MTKLTNTTAGPKGIHDKEGTLVMIEPNASADVELDAKDVNKDWFATGEKAAKEAEKADDKPAA